MTACVSRAGFENPQPIALAAEVGDPGAPPASPAPLAPTAPPPVLPPPASTSCVANAECVAACIAGVCQPFSATNGPCDDTLDCVAGNQCVASVCLGVTGQSCAQNSACVVTCIGGSCAPLAANGAACDDTLDCVAGNQCIAGVCLGDTGQSCAQNSACVVTCIGGSCAPLAASGAPCDDNADCAVGGDTCPAGVCVAVAPTVIAAAGPLHTSAIAGGVLKAWGDNAGGQLGDGTTTDRLAPTAVTGMGSSVTSVAMGEFHACAVRAGGVTCWGVRSGGRLGDGVTTGLYALAPVQVSGLASGAVAVAAGYYHSCALLGDATASCWGFPTSAIGAGTVVANTNVPNLVRNPTDTGSLAGITKIVGGQSGYHTCAIAGGALYCWGDNQTGALGDGTTTERFLPQLVSGLASGVVDVALNFGYTCAVLGTGAVRCIGSNAWGQLGDGTTTDRLWSALGLVSGASGVATGASHACVIVAGGVKCWGANSSNQLGAASSDLCMGLPCSRSPVAVTALPAGSGVVALVAGGGHTCASFASGTLKCWGANSNGELGNGTTSATGTPVTPVGY